ncbi:MAG: RNA polymerase sigma factor [Candidatus Magasanikbacteria bacterium]|nr:RNA polymerase sigma factor [Candidatus Magasanikbacteria bacterium]
MEVSEELRLVARAKTGDRDALGLLWDDLTPKLYGYLLNQLRQKDLAEDITQETWLKAINHLDKFKDRGVRFSAWVFAIARNECRQHWRGGNKEIPVDWTEEGADSNLQSTHSDDYLMIESVFIHLSNEEQEILRLRYLAELSFKEIAGILEISMIAARVRLHRALSRARNHIQK